MMNKKNFQKTRNGNYIDPTGGYNTKPSISSIIYIIIATILQYFIVIKDDSGEASPGFGQVREEERNIKGGFELRRPFSMIIQGTK